MIAAPAFPSSDQPSPLFISWNDYLLRTTDAQRMVRCYAAAKRANRVHRCKWRVKVVGRDEWSMKIRAMFEAPCDHCGSQQGQGCLGDKKLSRHDVWRVIEDAQGRCVYCNSLAVQGKPSDPLTGKPLRWASIGRRIGSLEHIAPYYSGRMNDISNLAWACLWCNTWPHERNAGAMDHGGFHP